MLVPSHGCSSLPRTLQARDQERVGAIARSPERHAREKAELHAASECHDSGNVHINFRHEGSSDAAVARGACCATSTTRVFGAKPCGEGFRDVRLPCPAGQCGCAYISFGQLAGDRWTLMRSRRCEHGVFRSCCQSRFKFASAVAAVMDASSSFHARQHGPLMVYCMQHGSIRPWQILSEVIILCWPIAGDHLWLYRDEAPFLAWKFPSFLAPLIMLLYDDYTTHTALRPRRAASKMSCLVVVSKLQNENCRWRLVLLLSSGELSTPPGAIGMHCIARVARD